MNLREKTITLGDRIFARVSRNGKTIFNFMTEQVSTMKELLQEIREAIKDVKGLVIIHIRNFNQGWGEERPMLLKEKDPGALRSSGSLYAVSC